MARPCQCGRAAAGPMTGDECTRCWLWLNEPAYRTYHGGDVKTGKATASRRLPCRHEGQILERCHSCNSELRHVRDCELHDEPCTRGLRGRVRCCKDCPDYQPAD